MNLGRTVTYYTLEGMPFYRCVSVYPLFVPSGFGERTGSEVNMGQGFSKSVIAATLLGSKVGGGGTRASISCEPDLLFLYLLMTTAL